MIQTSESEYSTLRYRFIEEKATLHFYTHDINDPENFKFLNLSFNPTQIMITIFHVEIYTWHYTRY